MVSKKAPREDPWSQKSPSGTSETLRWSRDPALPPLTSHGFLTSPASETRTERGECENGTKNVFPKTWEKKVLFLKAEAAMHVRKSESPPPGERGGGRKAWKEKLSVASWEEKALICKRIQ